MEIIAHAGNTAAPAYFALVAAGFSVTSNSQQHGELLWYAERGDLRLIADGPVELAGLAFMRLSRGINWKASDSQIAEFLDKFGHSL